MKKFSLSLIIGSLALSMTANAAEELSSEKAKQLQPYKEISVRGVYEAGIPDYKRAISNLADKEGVPYYYITNVLDYSANNRQKVVYANLYKLDSAPAKEQANFTKINGVFEYPKSHALKYEPYDIITIFGYFPTPADIRRTVSLKAQKENAYAFYIDRYADQGANQELTVFLFKKDAELRKVQSYDLIPYDSEAGQKALAQGGDAALLVEKPGYYSSSEFNEYAKGIDSKKISNNSTQVAQTNTSLETNKSIQSNSSTIKRYTVTSEDGNKAQELNDATALKMIPFKTISFRGYYPNALQISKIAGQKAIDNGAKYFHISRIAQDTKGPNVTVYVELFK